MASTINIPIGITWTLAAGVGDIAASAMNPTDTAEWIISDSGAPAESLIGHPVPRDEVLSMTLEGTEELYIRNTQGSPMTAAMTIG